MRGTTPTIHCDGDGGDCAAWDVDSYECSASSIDGIRLTTTHRALGWLTTARDEDLCPEHAAHEAKR